MIDNRNVIGTYVEYDEEGHAIVKPIAKSCEGCGERFTLHEGGRTVGATYQNPVTGVNFCTVCWCALPHAMREMS